MSPERQRPIEDVYRPALEPEPGRRCGAILHYQILEKIGQGRMGVVYRARDLKLDRLVALKLLSPDLLDSADARIRFTREVQALLALNHPHIANILNVEDAGDDPFLVLEYLPGGTLRAEIRRLAAAGRMLSMAQVLYYGVQIGAALAYAHWRGIVHRDVKTDNVLLGDEGQLKVTDFGLAAFRRSSPGASPGRAASIPAYMSPEQVRGRAVDHRSDIFSFGVVLYEMAAGEVPFHAQQEEAVHYRIVHAAPRPLDRVRPDVLPGWDAFLERVLAKNPSDRYQQMEDVLGELRRLGTA